jgi:riboflavin synthase
MTINQMFLSIVNIVFFCLLNKKVIDKAGCDTTIAKGKTGNFKKDFIKQYIKITTKLTPSLCSSKTVIYKMNNCYFN